MGHQTPGIDIRHYFSRQPIMTMRYNKVRTILIVAILTSVTLFFSCVNFINTEKRITWRVLPESEDNSIVREASDNYIVDYVDSQEDDAQLAKENGAMGKDHPLHDDVDLSYQDVPESDEDLPAPQKGDNVLKVQVPNSGAHLKVAPEGVLWRQNVQVDKFKHILKYNWVNTQSKALSKKLEEFGEFLTKQRQQVTADHSVSPENFVNYTVLYEGDLNFFQKVSDIRRAQLYFLPWTPHILEWLSMDQEAKQEAVHQLLPVTEYHPTFLSEEFILREFRNNSKRATSIVPESVALNIQAGATKSKINTFFFGYHGMRPHKPRFRLHMNLTGGWNLSKDCKGRQCMGLPDMLTYLLVLQGDKYKINLGTNGRIHVPDTEQRLVMSCCYEDYAKPRYIHKRYVTVDEVFDMTQNKIKATHHGLVESLTKLALFAPFLRQNPSIHLHFTPNGYSKVLIPIVLEMLQLRNPILLHEFHQVEANTVYVPPGMHCFRGGDLMSVQMTSHYFHQWTENKFPGNTTRDVVIILKRSSRHILNYNEVHSIIESHVKKTNGKLKLFEFYDKNLPPVQVMIQLFYSAQAIIGVHGAGLTNMIFSRPGTHLIEIMCPSKNPVFKEMAYKLGLYYYPSVSLSSNNCFVNGPLANIVDVQNIMSVIIRNINSKLTVRQITQA